MTYPGPAVRSPRPGGPGASATPLPRTRLKFGMAYWAMATFSAARRAALTYC